MKWLVVALTLSLAALAESKFQRNCTVYSDPSAIATRLCRRLAGDPVYERRVAKDGFTRVDTGDCLGYVKTSCLARTDANRSPASDGAPARKFRLGLAIQGDGLFGKAAAVTTGTQGFGFGLSLLAQASLSPRIRISLKPTYQYLSLSRSVSFAGVLAEPTEVTFTQKIPYLGAALLGSFRIIGRGEEGSDNDWWLDGGGEFLIPLSGRQSDSSGDSVSFHPTAKLFLALLGVSTRFSLGPRWDMGGYLHGYYNVSATGGSSFYGARLGLAISTHL